MGKMERYCSTGQSPQRAVAPTVEEEEEVNLHLNFLTPTRRMFVEINRKMVCDRVRCGALVQPCEFSLYQQYMNFMVWEVS